MRGSRTGKNLVDRLKLNKLDLRKYFVVGLTLLRLRKIRIVCNYSGEKMKNKKKTKLKMSFWMKLHAMCTIFLLLFYVTLGTFGGFGMLGNDLRAKYAWAASISVFIDGLPGKPIVTAAKTCANNVSAVHLAWTESTGATSNSITRDGAELASGFQTMSYVDSNVVGGTDYTYVVTASGAGGDSISDPLVVTARDCLIIVPQPSLELISLGGKEYLSGESLSTTKKIFKITGTTNLLNANIQIKTLPGPIFVSTLQANETGYWEYYLPSELSVGAYDFQITAVDPGDFLRNITKNYSFQVVAEQLPPPPPPMSPPSPPNPTPSPNENSGDNHHNHHQASNQGSDNFSEPPAKVVSQTGLTDLMNDQATQSQTQPQQAATEEIASMTVNLENSGAKIYRGQDAQIRILFINKDKLLVNQADNIFNLKYEILDKKNEVVFVSQIAERIIANQLTRVIHVPESLPDGNYTLRVSLLDNRNLLSGETSFIFVEMPIVNFGGGITASYTQLVSYVGWLALILLFLLLLLGFMFVLEYYLFKKALFTVDEYDLAKRGMVPHRKGVTS